MKSNNIEQLKKEADIILKKLFPICRSITGESVRETLSILKGIVDFNINEIPSGTCCYDWEIPDEWNIYDAYIKDEYGNKIIDFKKNNLHVVNYSTSINETISFSKLKDHLHTTPDLPSAIPYRTTYYKKTWGFCISHEQFLALDKNQNYHVYIDSTLKPGSLTYGEGLINGNSGQEFLISTYCCHPSLANDNLSGIVLWALLFRQLRSMKTRHSYRFIIAPETIGAIAYLFKNKEAMKKITGGFVLTTVAGPGKFGYKQTFDGKHLIDKIVDRTFKELNLDYISYPFNITGSDERQYSAPYFRIPLGTITKDKYQEYEYYHTSLDNLNFIGPDYLVETLNIYLKVIEKLEKNHIYNSLNPYCEPMLSKRGLYPSIGGQIKPSKSRDNNYNISHDKIITDEDMHAYIWLMFYSDGETSLLDISEKIDLPLERLFELAQNLQEKGLLKIL